jgi:hypothetical protein
MPDTIPEGEGPSTTWWDIIRRTPATIWNAIAAWWRK